MNRTTKIILFVGIILLIAGIIFFPRIKDMLSKDGEAGKPTARSAQAGGPGREPLQVNAKIIAPEILTDIIQVTGNLIPDEEVELSFEASGKITDIFFREGSAVKKGSLLAKVNDAPLQAELKKLEAGLPLAQERVVRQRTLLQKDAVSQEAFEQVTTDLDKLKADIELVKSKISQTELRAPFDGIIGLRLVSEGAYASPATVIAVLTKIVPLKLEFSIPEQYANLVKSGTPVVFTTPHNLAINQASVYAVEPVVDLSTRSLKVRALYPNTSGLLKPGGTASIEIRSNEIQDALVIPNESIIAEMGRDIVYLYDNGIVRQTEVRKGIRTAANIQIVDGLQPGDTLITTGVMQLRDGIPVKIISIAE